MPEKIANKKVKKIFEAQFGAEVNAVIADIYALSGKQTLQLRDIVRDIYYGKSKIFDLDNLLRKKLKLKPTDAKEMALSLAGKRFLIVDDYFRGGVSKYISNLGGNIEEYAGAVRLYKYKMDEEDKMLKESETAGHPLKIPAEERKFEKAPELEIKDPEKDAKDIGSIFDNQIVDILKWGDFRVKGELNVLTILLLIQRADFQNILLQKMTNNEEVLTKDKIEVGTQTLAGTTGNWLRDFISIVGVEGTVTTIEKARFMAESKNAKKLSREEGRILDMMLDTYVAIRNFPVDAQRKELDDITIFPFTEKDLEDIRAFVKKYQPEGAVEKAPLPKDIFELYMGSKEEQSQIESMKKSLETLTKGDLKKVSDELEVGFLRKDKFKTIAALMLLIEKGGFISLLKEDIRYRDYLTSYLNRLGKANLVDNFVVNPTEPQFVVFLLKYILQERLEMAEEEAARVATRFDTVYTQRGLEKYSRLAYYDMGEKKFKWA